MDNLTYQHVSHQHQTQPNEAGSMIFSHAPSNRLLMVHLPAACCFTSQPSNICYSEIHT